MSIRWTPEEEMELVALYRAAGSDGVVGLSDYCARTGREKGNVCRKAKILGLPVNPNRRKVEARKQQNKHPTVEAARAAISAAAKARFAAGLHPRGMAGKRHTPEVRKIIGEKSAAIWRDMTKEERDLMDQKVMAGRMNAGASAPKTDRGTWKAGWREIGDRRFYFRSRWEANYAFYLEWLVRNGAIQSWDYEPKTFWFEAIRRGVRSYKPDFLVTEKGGESAWHEVKGWMDARSKTTLARMAKYYPQEKVVLIREKDYKAIRRKALGLVPGWEDSARDAR